MSDILKELNIPKAMAPRLPVGSGVEFNYWQHIVAPNLDWREALTRDYWSRNFEKFRAGDTIEVHSADHQIQFSMRVLAINPATDPIYFEAVFLPILPPDLELPIMEAQRRPRFEVRLAHGQGSLFTVIDMQTGERLRDNPMARDVANELASSLQRAADATAAEALAAEFVRSREPVAARVPAPRPAAAEGAFHLHQPEGELWEIHGPGCSVIVSGLDNQETAERVLAAFSAPPPAEDTESADTTMAVAMLAARPLRPKPARGRGRPRKTATHPVGDDVAPGMPAAASELP